MFMMSTSTRIVAALIASALMCAGLASAPSAATAAKTLYVSPGGDDTASATAAAPLKTLGAALKKAHPGDRVQLAAGAYPSTRDEIARSDGVITVVGSGPDETQVQGLEIWGGQRLTFIGIRFTAPVQVQGHVARHAAQPATAIEFDNDEFVNTGTCLMIREGARDITVTDSRFRTCYAGIVGPGNPYPSIGIRIERDTIEQSRSDGIQFGNWSQVHIRDNLIADVKDPKGVIHNDGIQLTGNSTDVEISGNRIMRSNTQLVFIQDALGPIDGVRVVNNLLVGSAGVAVQSQGATNAEFVNNTIWGAKDGGIWLRKGYDRGEPVVVPTDTVLSNNIAPTIRYMEGAAPRAADGNVVSCPGAYSGITVPAGARCVNDPRFANAADGDYRLLDESPARALGSDLKLPETDLEGEPRSAPVPGAYN